MTSTLYRGGVVHSTADPFAEALLVDDGVIAWIGGNEAARTMYAEHVVDLDGAVVTPAFVDAHAHVLETGLALRSVDLSAAATLTDALAAVERAAREATGDETVVATGWDETAWPEDRPPTREEVDRAVGNRPAYLARVDVHSAVVSSALAEGAGLRERTGWREDGLVTVEAHHAARALARSVTAAERSALYREALAAAAAAGIVSVHEHSAPHVDTREGLAELLALGAHPAADDDGAWGRVHVVGYRAELCETVDDARDVLEAVRGLTGIGGDLNVDGALGSRTAALRAPYADAADTSGELFLSAEQIANHLTATTRAGVHSSFHVIGDRAMDEYLLGLAAAASVEGLGAIGAAGHRLEHAEMVDAPQLAALLLHRVRLSVQPAFDTAWGGPGAMYAQRLGPVRAAGLNPVADLAGAGIPLAFGSDSPVTPFDPWGGVRAALYHHQPEQRVTARAAFRAHTRGGWRLAGLDHTGAGELRVGAPAHLAVWHAESLAVQGPDGGVAAWSSDARAGTPLLPDLSDAAEPPVCLRTVRDGVVIHDRLDLPGEHR